MHLVTKGHLKAYRDQFPNEYNNDKLFEAFLNYSVLRQFSSDSVEPTDLIFSGDDPGIDGVLFVVGDGYVSTLDELEESLKGRNRDVSVAVIFTQAKTSESWAKHEINTFSVAIQDFLTDTPKFPMSEKLIECHQMFFKLFDHVGVIQEGRPEVHAHFATTDRASDKREIKAAFKSLKVGLENVGYFSSVNVSATDRDVLNSMWMSAGGSISAKIRTIGIAPFPAAPGIDASYVATVPAKEFISNILSDDDGKLRQRIFDENVRDYIGADNDVNEEIAQTIADVDRQKRFGVMNNGVTIISPDVRVQGVEIFMRDFQIINGCQTSNVLFDKREQVGDEANLMIKVVHAQEPTFIEDIVRSTNRQSKVQDEQFLASIETIKSVERYLGAKETDEGQKLYFERRKNQYAGRGIPAIRIFDVKQLARCVGAMFVERPDLASRYPNRLTGELKEAVFNPEFKEEIYYIAALTYYRIFLLFSNQRIDPRFSNLKWHLMMAIKVYLDDGAGKYLNSKKILKLCKDIEALVTSNEAKDVALMNKICSEIAGNQQLDRDQLRNQSLLQAMKIAAQGLK